MPSMNKVSSRGSWWADNAQIIHTTLEIRFTTRLMTQHISETKKKFVQRVAEKGLPEKKLHSVNLTLEFFSEMLVFQKQNFLGKTIK